MFVFSFATSSLILTRRLSNPLLHHAGGGWNSSVFPGKCAWSVLQPGANQCVESGANPAG